MRLLTLLVATVLLAACVHDKNDFTFFVTEQGGSLTYYVGGLDKTEEDSPWDSFESVYPEGSFYGKNNHDDPWDTINEKFGTETVHIGKGKTGVRTKPDDPWDTIHEKFAPESVHTGKSGEEDPWDRISDLFPMESIHTGKSEEEDPWSRIKVLFPIRSTHTGKNSDRYFLGFEKSEVVFVSFSYREPEADRARVAEVRGRVLRLEFTDGEEQYVINAPTSWVEGTQLETGFLEATSKKDRPFLGVRVWRTVEGGAWGTQSRNLAPELPIAWPSEYYASGAGLLVGLPAGHKSEDDPWNRIQELFPGESVRLGKNDKEHDDPWDTIRENFSTESTHTGSGKAHDDPWDTINANFPLESTYTGKSKASSFMGKPVVEMLFVSVWGDKGEEEDPWSRIGDLFSAGKNGEVLLELVEVRGQIGRFNFVSVSGDELLGGQPVFAVGVPLGWESGLVLRGEAYLLESKKMLPLMGGGSMGDRP